MQGAETSVGTSPTLTHLNAEINAESQESDLSFRSQTDPSENAEGHPPQSKISEIQVLAQELVSRHGLEVSLRLVGELVKECRHLMRSHGPRPKKSSQVLGQVRS